LADAVDIDIAAAPPEIQAEAKGNSVAVKLTSIAAAIPHPTLDRTSPIFIWANCGTASPRATPQNPKPSARPIRRR
jgi:hypothetical protein